MRSKLRRLSKRYGKKSWLFIGLGLLGVCLLGGGAYAALGGSIRQQASGDIELQRGLVGWWKLDGTAKDSSPYAHDGTINNAVTWTGDRKGKTSAAYSSTGTNEYINIPNFDHNVMRASAFNASWTLSIWAKASATGNNNEDTLIGRQGCNGGIYMWNGGYAFAIKGAACWTGAQTIAYNPGDITTNWHLLTATYNAGAMNFYVDGISRGTATLTDMTSYGTALGIGSTDGTGTYSFGGQLDDARVYTRALSVAEAKALYDSYDTGIRAASGQGGLVGEWKMDGNAKDSSPYGNNGTVNGATLTTDRKGKANAAYSFNGTSNYINVPSTPSLTSNVFSFSAWIKPTTVSINTIIGGPSGSEPQLRLNSNRLNFLKENVTDIAYGNTTITANTWYHVALTYSSSGVYTFYVNGIADGTGTSAQTFTAGNYQIGAKMGGAQEQFAGSIDDMRIYNRVLTPAEVKQQFDSYDSQINLNSSPTANTTGGNINQGLVGYWPFSGNAKDATPYSNNGTVNGATLVADRKGQANSAYSFNGTTSYIGLATINIPTAVSVSAWVYSTNFNQNGFIAGKNPVNSQWELFFEGPSLKWRGGAVDSNTICAAPSNNTWHHVVGTQNGTATTLYIDGAQCTAATTTAIGNGSGVVEIGRFNNSYYFNGSIDEVRVYDRQLSATEVQALYTNAR